MKQYFSYFKIWFIVLGILAILTGAITFLNNKNVYVRKNSQAPDRRVFDYANVLTDAQEAELEELIAKREQQIGCDLVLVTINESVLAAYGMTENTDANWERAMMQYADDFYDQNNFGYNMVHGDGALLLDNWYEGETGSWFSTCGRVYTHYSNYMINRVLDDVYDLVERDPYRAYRTYIENVYREMGGGDKEPIGEAVFGSLVISLIVAIIFVVSHLKGKLGKKTTEASTYLEQGSIRFNVRQDELIGKHVTSTVISTSSSGGSGGRSSGGGGGGHRSSGGVSHGGGGRRR